MLARQSRPAKLFNVPAPVGGLNARDAFTDMGPEDAVQLINVFPEASYCAVRGGYAENTLGLGSPVRTLLVWRGGSDERLFAGAGTSIWDCTTSMGSEVVTGLSHVDIQWTNINTGGSYYLIYVNGVDDMGAYDGTTWTTPIITGATSSTFENVCLFKERLWFACATGLDVYYLELQAIAGVATLFPLGAVFHRGGNVTNMGTFSRDAGEGPDDFLVFITDQGECAVYQGIDPSSEDTWQLVAMFDVGKPIGRRATVRINGDLAMITQDGIVSGQAALQYGRESIQKAAVTGKIQTLFSQYSQAYFSNFGWQPCLYPPARYLIVNVPKQEDAEQVQLVMNTVTGQWCQFDDMHGACWAMANNQLYFGGNDGIVYQADAGFLDNGGPIEWHISTAWQLQAGPINKYFTMVRPTMLRGGSVTYGIAVNVDFKTLEVVPFVDTTAPGGTRWNWTWNTNWLGGLTLDNQWRTVGAIGTWSNVHMTGTISGSQLQFNAFQIATQVGGPL